jgi:hypothetical protein
MEFYEGEGSLNTRIQHALVYIGKGSLSELRMEFYEGEGSLNTRIQHALVYIGKGSMPLTPPLKPRKPAISSLCLLVGRGSVRGLLSDALEQCAVQRIPVVLIVFSMKCVGGTRSRDVFSP